MSRWIARSVRSRWCCVCSQLATVAAGTLLVTASAPDPHGARSTSAGPRLAAQGTSVEERSSWFIPAAAHVSGALDTDWRTDPEVYNLGKEMAQYEIAVLDQVRDNSMPNEASFHLHAMAPTTRVDRQPGEGHRLVEFLQAMW